MPKAEQRKKVRRWILGFNVKGGDSRWDGSTKGKFSKLTQQDRGGDALLSQSNLDSPHFLWNVPAAEGISRLVLISILTNFSTKEPRKNSLCHCHNTLFSAKTPKP